MKRLLFATTLILQVVWLITAQAQSDAINIYIDADYSNNAESSESIERGLSVALSRVSNTLLGRPVNIIRKDHRGNSARSLRHVKQYLNDPDALLIVSGIHSPPLLAHRDYINEHGVLVLVPWAAAGPITRYPSKNNSIFRLSVDDTKAGQVISSFAVNVKGYQRPYLMLERTGWGRSNEHTMRTALKELGVKDVEIGWFDWNLKAAGARALLNQAIAARSDSIFLVANSIEGSQIVRVLASQSEDKRLPVLSHWGITAGDFHKRLPYDLRNAIDLHFIQTSFSFFNREYDPYEVEVLDQAKRLFPAIKSAKDITAPAGFIHAYDLGVLLIEAASKVDDSLSAEISRPLLRAALENIEGPVRGLVKTYEWPFTPYSKDSPDAHEALNTEDFVMAYYGVEDEIILHKWRSE